MKRLKLFIPLFVFIVLAIFLYIGLGKNPNDVPSALVGKPLPVLSLPLLSQEGQISSSELIGKPFLLNVWATWCPTCINEHPFLMTLAEQGVPIVGLNYKDDDNKAVRWLKQLGNPYTHNLVDADGRMGLNLGVYGAPETFIVDAQGIIRMRHAGDLNERVWASKLEPVFADL